MENESRNAWLVKCQNGFSQLDFKIHLQGFPGEYEGVHEKDTFILCNDQNNDIKILAFAKIYRKRTSFDGTTFFFDGVIHVENDENISELFLTSRNNSSISRLDWGLFEQVLQKACGIPFASFPILKGISSNEQAYIRELLQNSVIDDLLGPANGPYEEILEMSVRERYLVGRLAPQDTRVECDEDFSRTVGRVETEESEGEIDASTNQSLVPSSFGFTFCIDKNVQFLDVSATWGRYERFTSDEINPRTGKPFRGWKRIPSGGTKMLPLNSRKIAPFAIDDNCPEVLIQGTISEQLNNGERLITLFFINGQIMPEENQDQAWVFQPEVRVRDRIGRSVFQRRPVLEADGSDDEREALEMIYRNRVEFAVGHGISIKAITANGDNERAVEIRTNVIPDYEVPVTETPGLEYEDRPTMRKMIDMGYLDMFKLAAMSQSELIQALNMLTDDYDKWIQEQRARVPESIRGYEKSANEALGRCELVLKRLREGISILGSKKYEHALEAFRFANLSMASQRIRSIYALSKRRGNNIDLDALNISKNRSWRPFQLAFLLLSIPALADPTHPDRTESCEAYADLLWFPTGGGKTEAYLGVAAFAMSIRRLQGNLGGYDGGRGLAVIMRYTLRLLTLQQFQRATTLICAMEVLRRADTKKWGKEPFTIGLWVGKKVTPNTTKDSHGAIEKERESSYSSGSTPAQLTSCPWCGSEIASGRDIVVDKEIGRTFTFCGDKYGRCDFSRVNSKGLGLPILVVDEEIYRRPPSMLIATVDKFALMAWRGQIRTLFGRVSHECSRHGLLWPSAECNGNHKKKNSLPSTVVRQVTPIRPPDLIIQDEFHLISGPLGTMVGLYETAVDELASWTIDGKQIRPKVIASTATIRKADEQVKNVFMRKVNIFPPHGLDVEDNFFSIQRSIEKKPGRRYIGICSPGSSRPAVLIRVYVAFLTASQTLFNHFGQAADPYMTLVGYFNSLRELGGMKRLAEDDVQTRAYRVEMSNVKRPGLSQRSIRIVDELTSRITKSKDIPKKLDQLEIPFKEDWQKGEARAIDIVLATNMLSVGVDVNRLGLMVVNGQPKNTAEYIQATSRVGRAFPGLVCTVLAWSRPRDLSHYETFEHYHSTFYKHVEAQSVTPFAPRALDRGLTGTFTSMVRLDNEILNSNDGAQYLDTPTRFEAQKAKNALTERAWKVRDINSRDLVDTMSAKRIDQWVKEAIKPGRILGYETESGQGDLVALLKYPGIQAWDEVTVPMSMREVEPGVQLVMDAGKLQDPPQWKFREIEND